MRFVGELLNILEQKYPEYFEGEAMGFFNLNI